MSQALGSLFQEEEEEQPWYITATLAPPPDLPELAPPPEAALLPEPPVEELWYEEAELAPPPSKFLESRLFDPETTPGAFETGLTHGALTVAGSAASFVQYIGGKLGLEAMEQAGREEADLIEAFQEDYRPPTEAQGDVLQEDGSINWDLLSNSAYWAYGVADMVPSFAAAMVPGMGAGRAVQVLGTAVKWSPATVARLARIGAGIQKAPLLKTMTPARAARNIAGGAAGGIMEGTSTYREILAKGGTRDEAETAGELMALGAGVLNALSIDRLTRKLGPGARNAIVRYLSSGVWEGVTEYAEEPLEAGIKLAGGHVTTEEAAEQLRQGVNVLGPAMLLGMAGGAGAADRSGREPGRDSRTAESPESTGREQEPAPTVTRKSDRHGSRVEIAFPDGEKAPKAQRKELKDLKFRFRDGAYTAALEAENLDPVVGDQRKQLIERLEGTKKSIEEETETFRKQATAAAAGTEAEGTVDPATEMLRRAVETRRERGIGVRVPTVSREAEAPPEAPPVASDISPPSDISPEPPAAPTTEPEPKKTPEREISRKESTTTLEPETEALLIAKGWSEEETAEAREQLLEKQIAEEGHRENLARLREEVAATGQDPDKWMEENLVVAERGGLREKDYVYAKDRLDKEETATPKPEPADPALAKNEQRLREAATAQGFNPDEWMADYEIAIGESGGVSDEDRTFGLARLADPEERDGYRKAKGLPEPQAEEPKAKPKRKPPKRTGATVNNVVQWAGGISREEVERITNATGKLDDKRTRQALSRWRGGKTTSGTIEDFFEEAMKDEQSSIVLRKAKVTDFDSLAEAVRTGAFLEKHSFEEEGETEEEARVRGFVPAEEMGELTDEELEALVERNMDEMDEDDFTLFQMMEDDGSPLRAVALKLRDGTVHEGKPGQIHAEVLIDLIDQKKITEEEEQAFFDTGEEDGRFGFTDRNGDYLDREETAKLVYGATAGNTRAESYRLRSENNLQQDTSEFIDELGDDLFQTAPSLDPVEQKLLDMAGAVPITSADEHMGFILKDGTVTRRLDSHYEDTKAALKGEAMVGDNLLGGEVDPVDVLLNAGAIRISPSQQEIGLSIGSGTPTAIQMRRIAQAAQGRGIYISTPEDDVWFDTIGALQRHYRDKDTLHQTRRKSFKTDPDQTGMTFGDQRELPSGGISSEGKGLEGTPLDQAAGDAARAEAQGDLFAADEETPPAGEDVQGTLFQKRKHPMEASTRLPMSEDRTEDPVEELLMSNYDTIKDDEVWIAHNAKLVEGYTGIAPMDESATPLDRVESFIEHVADNLMWLHEKVIPAARRLYGKWYPGANKALFTVVAPRYSIEEHQAAGMTAVLSAQQEWGNNTSMLRRVLDTVTQEQDTAYSPEMAAWIKGHLATVEATVWYPSPAKRTAYLAANKRDADGKLLVKRGLKGKALKAAQKQVFLNMSKAELLENNLVSLRAISNLAGKVQLASQLAGKTFAQQKTQLHKAFWLRIHDEAHRNKVKTLITPDGQLIEDEPGGEPTRWAPNETIAKAISIYEDGSLENITIQLGLQHKVRNFYNNLLSPNSRKHITIDTHAVAAALLKALGTKAIEVDQNFGGTGSKSTSMFTGIGGTYVLYLEGYLRAAERLGITRENALQSITWEAGRALFTPTQKGDKKLAATIAAVWARHDAGELTIDQARDEVFLIAAADQERLYNQGIAKGGKLADNARDQAETFLRTFGPGEGVSNAAVHDSEGASPYEGHLRGTGVRVGRGRAGGSDGGAAAGRAGGPDVGDTLYQTRGGLHPLEQKMLDMFEGVEEEGISPAFILSDGRTVPRTRDHAVLAQLVVDADNDLDALPQFLIETGAVRTTFSPNEVGFSVDGTPSPIQMRRMAELAKGMGRIIVEEVGPQGVYVPGGSKSFRTIGEMQRFFDQQGDTLYQRREPGYQPNPGQRALTQRIDKLRNRPRLAQPQIEELRRLEALQREQTPTVLHQKDGSPFFSQIISTVQTKMPSKASAQQAMGLFRKKNKKDPSKWDYQPGIKAEEFQYLEIETFLEGKKTITKEELLGWVESHQVEVVDFTYGSHSDWGSDTQYEEYTLPGGEDYQERVLTWNLKRDMPIGYNYDKVRLNLHGDRRFYPVDSEHGVWHEKSYATREEAEAALKSINLYSRRSVTIYDKGHFDDGNVVVSMRYKTRIGTDGKKELAIEEIQSDWHQTGRKRGYIGEYPQAVYDAAVEGGLSAEQARADIAHLLEEPLDKKGRPTAEQWKRLGWATADTEIDLNAVFHDRQSPDGGAVPDAPFKKTWHELGFKRMLAHAVEGGYDRVTWTTGERQSERYDLSKKLDRVEYRREDTGTEKEEWYEVVAYDKEGETVYAGDELTLDTVEEVVGKEVAEKIQKGEGEGTWPRGLRRRRLHPDFGEWRALKGLDLEVGGEGMKGFYDKMLPAFAAKYGKKHGATVSTVESLIPNEDGKRKFVYDPAFAPQVHTIDDVWEVLGQGDWGDKVNRQLQAIADYMETDRGWRLAGETTIGTPFDEAMAVHGSSATAEFFEGKMEFSDFTTETMHSMEITPELKAHVAKGQALFQDAVGAGGEILAQITKKKNLPSEITLMKGAQADSIPHEVSHVFFEQAENGKFLYLADEEGRRVWDWLGLKEGETLNRPEHERLADAVVDMLFGEGTQTEEGSAIRRILRQFAEWLRRVALGSAGVQAEFDRTLKNLYGEAESVADLRQQFAAADGAMQARKAFLAAVSESEVEDVLEVAGDILPEATVAALMVIADRKTAELKAQQQEQAPETEAEEETVEDVPEGEDPVDTAIESRHRQTGLPPEDIVSDTLENPGFFLKDETLRGKLRQKLQDSMARVIDVQRAIGGDPQGQLPEEVDVVLAAELMIGQATQKIDASREELVSGKESFIKRLTAAGYAPEEFGDYLYALHAPERNAHVREKIATDLERYRAIETPTKTQAARLERLEDLNIKGSGMADQEAAEIVALHQGTPIEAFATEFREKVTRKALDVRLEAGLIDQATYDRLEEAYVHYVPLKGVEGEEETRQNTGSGVAHVPGQDIRAARGRLSKANNPLMQGMIDLEEAIVRGEKNKVGNTLIRLVEENPNVDIWEAKPQKHLPVFNSLGEVEYVSQVIEDSKSILDVKVDGQTVYVEIKDEPMARSLKGLGGGASGFGIDTLQKVNAYLRAVSTTLNPEFLITNMERDLQTAMIHLSAEHGIGVANQVANDVVPWRGAKAGMGIWREIRDGEGEWADYYTKFKEAGGKVGWFDQQTLEDKTDHLSKEIEKARKTGVTRKTWQATGKFVENLNEAVESGVRLAAFRRLIENGMSEKRAAQFAKNMTVNFNKKGEWGSAINALWLFSNASIQGTARIATALGNPLKKPTRGQKRARRIVGGLMAASFASSYLNRMISEMISTGDDDDPWEDISPWVKDNYWLQLLPNGKTLAVKVPYGYNIFLVIGRVSEELANGGVTKAEAMSRIMNAANDAFNPMGGGSLAQFASPTFLDLPIQIALNENFAGMPIQKDQPAFGPDILESQRYFNSVRDPTKAFTTWLNKVTGGSNLVAGADGWGDVSPEVIDHLVDFAGGGLGKFGANLFTTGHTMFVEGDIPDINNVPVFRQFMKEPNEWTPRRLAMDILDKAGTRVYPTEQQDRFLDALRRAERGGAITADQRTKYAKDFIRAQLKARHSLVDQVNMINAPVDVRRYEYARLDAGVRTYAKIPGSQEKIQVLHRRMRELFPNGGHLTGLTKTERSSWTAYRTSFQRGHKRDPETLP